ncbi:ribonuclease III [Candidatus Peregrinibacteria bacterium]|nr:ribonuclease III [Candidatus Peregrinibacteria bacterium]
MYKKLEEKIGIAFGNPHLLRAAFVHRSYLNEHRSSTLENNERLEFLGDAVLELAVTEYLYSHYPTQSEGDLTNWRAALVRGERLARVAHELRLGEYLFLSHGEEMSGGRNKDYLLANALEALIGVIYLEKGYIIAQNFITAFVLVHLETILKTGEHIDPKTRFQELVQEKMSVTPIYQLLQEAGPDHDKKFTMGAYIEDRLVGRGIGNSKQNAEQKAAENALETLKLSDE